MSDFKPVLLTLPSLTPSLAVEILPHGLTIHRIFVQADGKTHDIVVGPEDPEHHLQRKYTNTIVGRYTNRLPSGKHTLEKDGITSELTVIPDTEERPLVSLHGGPKGFDSFPFTLLGSASESTLFTKSELDTVAAEFPSEASSNIWRLVSEDGDQGFPGKLTVEVLVGLKEASDKGASSESVPLGSVVIVYRAKVEGKNGEKVVTPVNLTQHWGFNLDASQKDQTSFPLANDHNLTMKASHTVDRDELSLPTGKLNPVDGAHVHDGKKIAEKFPEGGYDDFYVLSQPASLQKRIALSELTGSVDLIKPILSPSDGSKSLVELSSSISGLKLNFETNQNGVQFYSDNGASPALGARKKIHGGSGDIGDGYVAGSAAFLEFHEPLAAFLHPQLQRHGDDTLLTSDEVYHNFVKLDVAVRSPRGV